MTLGHHPKFDRKEESCFEIDRGKRSSHGGPSGLFDPAQYFKA